ncbi:site-specific DNA-methyltransferase [Paremcibacter congregatus]|uniref:site-specific DNA-methyltransferase n=1 Tax=Paremcibacter congregatus TaxID=2043170 RepID=UPI0030EF595E|tara:strand:- start:14098 stop:16071 length:1974 start_codon:yes stop_codon:yes gene_type:complete
MEKLKMHSPDLTDENIAKIRDLFPNCVTEAKDENGKLRLAVDFDQLRQELSDSIVEGPQERYRLDWPGKREALLTANSPIAKTLRPARAESVDFDTTQNLFIEGDNLEALKLLQETYLGKVKMIYIDPPYNTGNDFIYEDDFAENSGTFLTRTNQVNDDGDRLVANPEGSGRFHSDWLSMMYSRLRLTRNLLSDNGVIMISIGDAELHNMKKIADEIFGESNFILTFSRMMKSGGAKGRFYTPSIDYILVYAKSIEQANYFRKPLTAEQISRFYNKTESSGARQGELYGEERLYKASLDHRPNQRYFIECPDGSYVIPPGKNFPSKIAMGEKVLPTSEDGVWKWIFSRYKDELDQDNIVFKETSTSALVDEKGNQSRWNIYNKLWLKEQQEKGSVPSNLITSFENRQSSAELKALSIPFDFSKPVNLIKYLAGLVGLENNDILLDFFAGSATTAHATIQLNAEDGGNRKFIMVQLPEETDEKSEAFKAGYKTISEISKERIRRAGKKILEGDCHADWNKDIGFRVLKIDTSNMANVYYTPQTTKQADLLAAVDNIKLGRDNPEDLLFQVLVDWGVDLTLPIRREIIQGKTVFFVNHEPYDLVACFDKGITEELVKELATFKPVRVVFRDNGFVSDAVKINVDQIFRQLSPATDVKSI